MLKIGSPFETELRPFYRKLHELSEYENSCKDTRHLDIKSRSKITGFWDMPLGHELGSWCQRKSYSTQRVHIHEKNYKGWSSFDKDMGSRSPEAELLNLEISETKFQL